MKQPVLLLLLLVLILPVRGERSENNLRTEFRVRPDDGRLTLICRAKNVSKGDVIVDRVLLHRLNCFDLSNIDDPNREWSRFGAPHGMPIDSENISVGKVRQWQTNNRNMDHLYYTMAYDNSLGGPGKGGYSLIRWHLNRIVSPQKILLGIVGKGGEMRTPIPRAGQKEPEVLVGLIYDQNKPLEFAFLFINGEDKNILVEKPLTRNSRMVAISPAIGYTRELFIAASASERIVVEAGKVGEWRLPWQTVLDLIPKDDLERIKAAGGDLDLVWKVGEYQSDPLPLSLADPENITRSSEK